MKRKRNSSHGQDGLGNGKHKEPNQVALHSYGKETQPAVIGDAAPQQDVKNSRDTATEHSDINRARAARRWLSEELRHLQELQNDPSLQDTCISIAGKAFVDEALAQIQKLKTSQVASELGRPFATQEKERASAQHQHGLPSPPEILDANLAEQTFTHRSVVTDPAALHSGNADYERLEFIGDSYLYPMCAEYVSEQYPTATPGKMSAIRQDLLQNETLAHFSRLYGFDQRLKINPETALSMRSNAKTRKKILGDVFEAYVAAVVKSRPSDGWGVAQRWLNTLWKSYSPRKETIAPPNPLAKLELTKMLYSKNITLKYEETSRPRYIAPGREEFTIGVYLTGWGFEHELLGVGKGTNKAEAGVAAANAALRSELTANVSKKRQQFDRLREQETNRDGGPRQDILQALEKEWKC